ncbi:DNA topoisomerase IB [Altererythrobacter sp. CAU 1778]
MASVAPPSSKLIYIDDSMPGISRKRAGKGWAYYDPQGKLIRDAAEKKRLNAIALPPAYTDEWFCPASNGHILATGYDARGRKQYRYHPDFRAMREGEKFDGCAKFGNLLPLVRKRVEDDLKCRTLSRERAVASVVRLLDLGALRVGNESYAKSNKSFGATTLRQRHAEVTGRTLKLRYRGKSGKDRVVTLTDGRLARVIRRMQDLPGQHLFKYEDGDTMQAVSSDDVNAYLRETMGADFTAKNFRTWHASVMAYSQIASASAPLTIKSVIESVAAHLGNTAAVTRKSYIHPGVIALIDDQEGFRAKLRLPRSTRWMTREERGLIALLEEGPEAQSYLTAA